MTDALIKLSIAFTVACVGVSLVLWTGSGIAIAVLNSH